MASKAAHKRLTKEYVTMQREPPPFVWAAPDERNILLWNFIIRGPPDSPYADGEYHGVLMFPSEYPFKPPGIKMITPSGRFQPEKKICFSMSDFHPGSWNPAWSVATILTGLLSFMLADEMTTGGMNSSDSHKRTFAFRSHPFNIANAKFKEAFPDYTTPELRDLPNMGEKERGPDQQLPKIQRPNTAAPLLFSAAASALSNPGGFHHQQQNQQGASTGGITQSNDAVASSTWSVIIWQKWRWGLLLALAVLVSRFSATL